MDCIPSSVVFLSWVRPMPVPQINKSSAVAEMDNRLATIDMGRKVRVGFCDPFGVSRVPI